MVGCPKCGSDESDVGRTWDVFLSGKVVRLRKRICYKCACRFTSYEISFDNDANIKEISDVIDAAITFFPPVTKVYKVYQQNKLF